MAGAGLCCSPGQAPKAASNRNASTCTLLSALPTLLLTSTQDAAEAFRPLPMSELHATKSWKRHDRNVVTAGCSCTEELPSSLTAAQSNGAACKAAIAANIAHNACQSSCGTPPASRQLHWPTTQRSRDDCNFVTTWSNKSTHVLASSASSVIHSATSKNVYRRLLIKRS
jgi:hypothetical protein